MGFVHLRVHTEYSVVDGTLRIDDAVAAARADGQPALAITDLANLFGAVKFYKACRGKGVQPLIGADLWMQPEGADKQPGRLLVLVQDARGYHHLSQLIARAWTGKQLATYSAVEVQGAVTGHQADRKWGPSNHRERLP